MVVCCKIWLVANNIEFIQTGLRYFMDRVKEESSGQSDKKFNIIALCVFLPIAAVLKVYFFLR